MGKIPVRKLSYLEFNDANLKLIIETVSPFSLIEHPAFITYCKLTSNKIPVSMQSLVCRIKTLYGKMIEEMITDFEKIKCAAPTLHLFATVDANLTEKDTTYKVENNGGRCFPYLGSAFLISDETSINSFNLSKTLGIKIRSTFISDDAILSLSREINDDCSSFGHRDWGRPF
ncbi:hypothetical protein QTP88_027162 [Uroleucon formosanum]